MPKKYNSHGKFEGNITEKLNSLQNTNKKAANMMSDIIKEQQNIKNTTIIDMVGVLTPVTYFQTVSKPDDNYATDSSTPNKIAATTQKYKKIYNFLIKLNGKLDFSTDGEEENKDYNQEGSLIILPRTLKPTEGDLFLMEYFGKLICYKITSVELNTFASDPGFECKYTIKEEGYEPGKVQIISEYIYNHELVGTTYRPILSLKENENLKKFKILYNHISDVFNSLFYDRNINSYIYKEYDNDKSSRIFIKDNNNINSLGNNNGLLRANYDNPQYEKQEFEYNIKSYEKYDNFLNYFIQKHNIFCNFEELTLSPEPLFQLDRIGYKRSIYGCLETRSVAYFKNTSVSPVYIEYLQPGIVSFLVGKQNIIYSENKSLLKDENISNFFPNSLINQVSNGNSIDMDKNCTEKVYNSVESYIIESIARFIYKKTDDFTDRLLFLYDNIDNLNEVEIKYNEIFYLFPLLGYIIEQILREMYSDNTQNVEKYKF